MADAYPAFWLPAAFYLYARLLKAAAFPYTTHHYDNPSRWHRCIPDPAGILWHNTPACQTAADIRALHYYNTDWTHS